VEDAEDITAGTVDMVFATNVTHFPDQKDAMTAVAKQLKSGGTLACGTFGPARFEEPTLQDL
jgi:chemotaxis methyl-accepting protein methylase